jgi:hypothetical protein
MRFAYSRAATGSRSGAKTTFEGLLKPAFTTMRTPCDTSAAVADDVDDDDGDVCGAMVSFIGIASLPRRFPCDPS